LTDAGGRVVTEVRARKIAMLGVFLAGWTEEEVARFTPLLDRFSAWSDQDASAVTQAPDARPTSASEVG
jgi:hypothetical protein